MNVNISRAYYYCNGKKRHSAKDNVFQKERFFENVKNKCSLEIVV